MNEASAFPLCWPSMFPRATRRETGQFKSTLPSALKNVQDSLRRFGADSNKKIDALVISSNVTLGAQRPADPGVAVWFTWDGLSVCIPVDRYATVEANLQAIHHIIEARRVELRHGTLALVRASMTGFKALPAPVGKEWWNVLGLQQANVTMQSAKEAYRKIAAHAHPDKHGGSNAAMATVNAAWEEAQRALT